jgi:DNA-binding Lrp family transcriptional regulator
VYNYKRGEGGGLTSPQYKLLARVMSKHSCFDSKDNTFLLSNSKIAFKVGVHRSTIDRLIKVLRKRDLIRRVTTICGSYLMLNPIFITTHPRETYWYSKALYFLGYNTKADRWALECWTMGLMIDPQSGEVLKKSPVDCLSIEARVAGDHKDFGLHLQVIRVEAGERHLVNPNEYDFTTCIEKSNM